MIMTETTKIDVPEALALLEQAVATQGADFVYNPGGQMGCEYGPIDPDRALPDDPRAQTGCLIGVALRLADIDLTDQTGTIKGMWEERARRAMGAQLDRITHGAARVLQAAQSVQDQGGAWGYALTQARIQAEQL